MSNAQYILGPMRLPFLILTPACVLLGLASASWTEGAVDWLHFALILVGAIAAHVSVNALNEYFDFKSGLDMKTRRTPFSGGSGVLPANPEKAPVALATGLAAMAITGAIGVFFLVNQGLILLPLGLLGILLVYTYTIWLTRSAFLCLIAPGLGFGICMVMGTDLALTGAYSWTAFVVALLPFFLVNNLLLINQFPDVDADRSIGRRHLPILAGRRTSAIVYGAFLISTYLAVVVGVVLKLLPLLALLGLATLFLAIPNIAAAYRHADQIEKLIPYLARNVMITIATPVLVAVGMLIA